MDETMETMDKTEELKARVKEFMQEFKEDFGTMDEIKEWDSLEDVFRNLPIIVGMMRDVALMTMWVVGFKEEFTDSEIKEVIKKTLDDMIKLKGIKEWISDILIGALVDGAFAVAQQQRYSPDEKAVALRGKIAQKMAKI